MFRPTAQLIFSSQNVAKPWNVKSLVFSSVAIERETCFLQQEMESSVQQLREENERLIKDKKVPQTVH